MKKLTAILAAAVLMLTACAEDSENYKDDSLVVEKKEISKLYEGYEELQGKDFGSFRLPEHIEPQSFEKVYTITADIPFDTDDSQKRKNAQTIFKNILKDEYDEKAVTREYWLTSFYKYSDKNSNAGKYAEGEFFVQRSNDVPNSSLRYDYEFDNAYYVETEGDKAVDFFTEQATVRELAESAENAFNGNSPDFADYHAKAYEIVTYKYKYGSVLVTKAYMRLEYEGVPFEPMTPTSKTTVKDDKTINTYYSSMQAEATFTGKNSITRIGADTPFKILNKTEDKDLISLKDACDILKHGLAEYLSYDFFDVKLKYVNLFDQEAPYMKELSESEQKEIFKRNSEIERVFEPTWVFSTKSGEGENTVTEYIKVNALTGEIAMDLSK